ncbi:hypothetical protein [Jannaschia pohangensis]|nr:hypothetical protein [Jannaschia pohangensis]
MQRSSVLAVGLSPSQVGSIPSRLVGTLGQGTHSVSFQELGPDRLDSAMIVLSPVVGVGFDAVDVAMRLHAADFRGRYIAFAPTLPNYELIRREVQGVAPDLNFDIIETGRGPHLAGR